MIKGSEFSTDLLYLVSMRNNFREFMTFIIDAVGSISVLPEDLTKFVNRFAARIGFKEEQLIEAERLLCKWKKSGISVITYFSEEYPELLKQISDPPMLIYCKGELPVDVSVSIVGSRIATSYGVKAASQIADFLASNRITITSGMAKGIDSAAHSAAIKNGGKTIAVLGSGVDIIYPPENKRLYDQIIENGAVISEFEPGSYPSRWSFPQRNRIISGLSIATIVVEATKRSGALITARLAAKQGRTVMAVPGSIFSETSRGTNALIKDGAIPFTNYRTLVDELVLDVVNILHRSHEKHKKLKPDLSGNEKAVYDCLDTKKTIDQITDILSLDSAAVSAILTKLEISNLIAKQGSRFERKQ